VIKPNSEKCHIKRRPGLRQTRWDLQVTTYNVGQSITIQ